jgi:hypothetical protein
MDRKAQRWLDSYLDAEEAGALQEIAAAGIGQIAAFRHGVLQEMA